MTNAQGVRAGRAYVELALSSNKLDAGLDAARSKINAFASATKTAMASAFAISAPVALAVRAFADFDDQMRLVQGATQATGDEFAALTETAKELGRTTSWTASQVAQGMTSLGRAGFQTEEINASIASVMDLARATGTELSSATDIAANALRAFGLDASNMSRVCDVLTATANGSAQTLDDLGEAFKYVAPIAASTGHTIEDTAKIIGALANFGVKGSQAGTVIKSIQTRLASDKKAIEKYAELGIATTDDSGNLRKLNDVLIDLGKTLQNMPSGERLQTIKTLFGNYGLTGVSITTANFEELNKAIDDADGAAARVAQTMDSGIGGAIRITKSAIEGLSLSVGESMVPALSKVAATLQNAAGALTQFSNAHPNAISEAAMLAVKVGAGAAALYATAKACSAVVGAVRLLSSAYRAVVKAVDFLVGASRAASAAQKAQAATTAALSNVQKAATAVNSAKTASELAAAQADLALATAEYKSAAATQAATAAKARSTAASVKAIAATTAAVVAVAALATAYFRFATAADRAAQKARAASDAIDMTREQQRQRAAGDADLFKELQNLESQQSLTSEQFARAQYIVAELSDRYGDLGLRCDEAARKINGMATAQDKFNAAQRAQTIQEAKDNIATYTDEIERNNAALASLQKRSSGFGLAVKSFFETGSVSGAAEAMVQRTRELQDRNRELARLIKQEQNTLDFARAERDAAAPKPQQQPPTVYGPTAPNAETANALNVEPSVVNVDNQIEPPVVNVDNQPPSLTIPDINVDLIKDNRLDAALAPLESFDDLTGDISKALDRRAETKYLEQFDFQQPTILTEPLTEEFSSFVDALGNIESTISRSFDSSGTFSAFEQMGDDGAAQLSETKRQTRILESVREEIRRQNNEDEGDWI